MANTADIELLFGVAGSGSIGDGSGRLIATQLSRIVSKLEDSSVTKLKFKIDDSSLESIKKQMSSMGDKIPSFNFDGLKSFIDSAGEIAKSFSNLSSGANGINSITTSLVDMKDILQVISEKSNNVNISLSGAGKVNSTKMLELQKEKALALYEQISKLNAVLVEYQSKVKYSEQEGRDIFIGMGNADKYRDNILSTESVSTVVNNISKLTKIYDSYANMVRGINSIGVNIDTSIISSDRLTESENAILEYKNRLKTSSDNINAITDKLFNNMNGKAEKVEPDIDTSGVQSKIKPAIDEIGSMFDQLRAKIESTFDFSTINIDTSNIKSKIDEVISGLDKTVAASNVGVILDPEAEIVGHTSNGSGINIVSKDELNNVSEINYKLELARNNAEALKEVAGKMSGESSLALDQMASALNDANLYITKITSSSEGAYDDAQKITKVVIDAKDELGNVLRRTLSIDDETGEIVKQSDRVSSSFEKISSSSNEFKKAEEAAKAYGSLISKIGNMSQASFSPEEGIWKGSNEELVSRLNAAKQSYEELTSAQERNKMSSEEQAEIDKIMISIMDNYAIKLGRNKAALNDFSKSQNTATKLVEQASQKLVDWGQAEKSRNASSVKSYNDLRDKMLELKSALDSVAEGTYTEGLDKFDEKIRDLRDQIFKTGTVLKQNRDDIKTFGNRFARLTDTFSAYFSVSRIFYGAYNKIKEMISTTIELNQAFTQLRIVTGATESQMEKFSNTAFTLSKRLGSSTTEIVSSIETFSRLGYSLDNASKLAEFTTILSNVADVDMSEATTGLTSIIKGFNLDVTDVEHVADVLVQVGQKYAVSASEMMEAYTKSSAALNATNTSFEKSAGLIAAANASVQDASVVGTALKTISARIRGSKTDLEALGEDTSDLASSFSKYADEIKSLTNFDIMADRDTGTFKDLYDIFDGLADVWNNLNDTQQARVSEILGGTRQLQVISSILGNWSDAEGALADAINSSNVAYDAQNIYLESTQGHIDKLKASFEELAYNFVDSGFLSDIVDIANMLVGLISKLVDFLNKLGGIKTLLYTIISIISIKKINSLVSSLSNLAEVPFKIASRLSMMVTEIRSATIAEDELSVSAASAEVSLNGVEASANAAASGVSLLQVSLGSVLAIMGILMIVANKISDNINQSLSDVKESVSETKTAIETIESYELYSSYLKSAIDSADAESKQNEALQKVVSSLGDKSKALDGLKENSKEYNEILKDTVDKLKEEQTLQSELDLNNAKKSISQKYLSSYSRFIGGSTEIVLSNDDLQQLKDVLGVSAFDAQHSIDKMLSSNFGFDLDRYISMFSTKYTIDREINSVSELIEYYNDLISFRNQIFKEGMGQTDFFKELDDKIKTLKEDVDVYYDSLYSAAVMDFYSNNETPQTLESLEAMKASMEDYISSEVGSKEIANSILLEHESDFNSIKNTIEEASDKLNEYSNEVNELNNITRINNLNNGLKQLSDIFNDISDKGSFDFSSIIDNDDFEKAFGSLDSYESFILTVANSSGDIDKCRESFNNLAKEYIYNSGALNKLTDDNKDYAIEALRQMGIANSEEVVLHKLALVKLNLNNVQIKTTHDIVELIKLAKSAGIATESLQRLSKIKEIVLTANQKLTEASIAASSGNDVYADKLTKSANALLKTANAVANAVISGEDIEYAFEAYESESKSKSKTWFETQLAYHKHQVAMYKETDKEYLDWLNDAYKRAYNEGIIEIDDYYQYQEEVFEGLRDLFNDYLGDIESEISLREAFDNEDKNIISLYKDLMSSIEKELKNAYSQGLKDTDDYIQDLKSKWVEYRDAIKEIEDGIKDDAKSAAQNLIDIRVEMIKKDIENEKEAIDKKLDYLKEFYDKQKQLLEDSRDEEKYLEDQAEKRKAVIDLQEKLDQLEYDNSAWAQKRKVELAEDLAEAQSELREFEKDHALELAQEELDKLYEMQEKELNAQSEILDEQSNNAKALYDQALNDIKNGSIDLYNEMISYNELYGDGIKDTITSSWEEAYKALSKYKSLYGESYNGISLSNVTGYTGNSFSESVVSPAESKTNTASGSQTATSKVESTGTRVKATTDVYIRSGAGKSNASIGVLKQGDTDYVTQTSGNWSYLKNKGGWVNSQYIKAYASGTSYAASGLARVNENGEEYILYRSADGSKYRLFSGGEKVLNSGATNFLYNFANSGQKMLSGLLSSGGGVSSFSKLFAGTNNITMGDIIIQGSADQSTVSAIRRSQRESLDTMLKSINRLNK